MTRLLIPLFAVGLGVAGISATLTKPAGARVTVGREVPPGSRVPVDRIDHTEWDRLLRKYVDDRGMVDYASWKASAADSASLDGYLMSLSTATFPRESPVEAHLAYWINAYNAVTVKGILREYPTSSIRNHTPRLVGYHIWKDLQLLVDDRSLSLEAIEHEILRKTSEPRIHFAIVCASIGCPPLRNEAYVPERLNDQLASNSRAFFADPDKFRFDPSSGTIAISPIIDWFADDFGRDLPARLATIGPYLPEPAAREIARQRSVRMTFLDYDWSLNERHR